MEREINTLTLEESITPKSEEVRAEKVKEFSQELCNMVRDLYTTYNFFRQDPVDEKDGHMMVFSSRLGDEITGAYHERMFKLAFDNSLTIFETNKQFKKDVEEGKAIELGDVVIIETAHQNVLTGNEFNLSITFMLKEVYEEKKRIEKEEEEKLDL